MVTRFLQTIQENTNPLPILKPKTLYHNFCSLDRIFLQFGAMSRQSLLPKRYPSCDDCFEKIYAMKMDARDGGPNLSEDV